MISNIPTRLFLYFTIFLSFCSCGKNENAALITPSETPSIHNDTAMVGYVKKLNKLASRSFNQQDFTLAETYCNMGLEIIKGLDTVMVLQKVFFYSTLANAYLERQMMERALSCYDSCILIAAKAPVKIDLTTQYYNRSICYMRMDKFDEALMSVEQAIELNKEKPNILHFISKSDILNRLGRYKEAVKILEAANIAEEKDNDNLIYYYFSLGASLINVNKNLAALDAFQKSLTREIEDYHNLDWMSTPTFEQLEKAPLAFVSLGMKIQALDKLWVGGNDEEKYFILANKTCAVLDSLLKEPFSAFGKDFYNLELAANEHLVCGQVIDFYYHAFEVKKDSVYLEKALSYIEQNHALLMKVESFMKQHKEEVNYGNNFENQKNINLLLVLNKKLLDSRANKKNVLDSLTVLTTKLENKELPKNSETYTPSINNYSLQQMKGYCLANKVSIVIFHEQFDRIYAMSVTPYKVNYRRITKDEDFKKDIVQTINYQHTGKTTEKNTEFLHRVYQKTLDSLLIETPDCKRLVIIPDSGLAKLSFEGLLTGSDLSNKKNWLLHKYAISYAHSIGQLLEEKPKISIEKGVAFGYSSEKTIEGSLAVSQRGYFGEIPGCITEINNLKNIFGNAGLHTFLGNDATLQRFLSESENADLIHLALHATTDPNDYFNSNIYFRHSKDTITAYSSGELLNSKIHPKFAVLTACNTGNGRAAAGEGIFSLARVFFQMGSQAVVMSLWENNDYASPKLMKSFYENIAAGQPIDIAMQQAKITFLENETEPLTVTPNVWSGLSVMGRQEVSINNKSARFPIKIGIAILILLIISLLFRYFSFWK